MPRNLAGVLCLSVLICLGMVRLAQQPIITLEPPRPHAARPAEVTPAAMPAGRGDELVPTG